MSRSTTFALLVSAFGLVGVGCDSTQPAAAPKGDMSSSKEKGKMDGGMMDKPKTDGGMMDKPKTDGGMMDKPKTDGGMMDKPKTDGGMMGKGKTDSMPK